MGKVLAPFDFAAVGLVLCALSLTPIKKGAAHPFDFLRANRTPCPNCLDAYLVPMIIPLPNINESEGFVVR